MSDLGGKVGPRPVQMPPLSSINTDTELTGLNKKKKLNYKAKRYKQTSKTKKVDI